MDTKRKCPGCQKELEPNAPDGLCPACLMKAGLGTGVNLGPDSQGGSGRMPFAVPTAEEVAGMFPQLEVLGFIGQGGMGVVYKARQKELDRVVALKILPPDIGKDPAFAERFTREAKALAKLNHPGIVTLYEFGKADVLFFFLMEFVDGVSLRRLLEGERISAREALAIVPQICDALQYAHDQGIVHRDIKPENILLDRQGRVKVADFGLAKLMGPAAEAVASGNAVAASASLSLTDAGKVMGTPQYMAPEQREHPTEVDHRADIYSLGVVFYQMLTGELPGKPIEAPSHKVRVDVRLDEVVLRALEKLPDRRYQRASEVKTAVETITNTPPSAQPQVPPAYVPQKAARPMKRRLGVLAVVLALAALALALPLGWWRIHHELQNWSFFDAQRTLGVHHTMTAGERVVLSPMFVIAVWTLLYGLAVPALVLGILARKDWAGRVAGLLAAVVAILPFLYLGWSSKESRHRIEVIQRDGAFPPTGQVRPTRLDRTNAMAKGPSHASTTLSFGPEIEGVIQFGTEKACFDLDSGQFVVLPDAGWMNADKLRQAGVDLYHSAIQNNLDCLDAIDLLLVPLEGVGWEKVMAASVADAISRAQNQQVTDRRPSASMRPGTYAFFNGTSMGLLQNAGMTGPSPGKIDGVKFRYRLLSGTPTSPATSARHAAATNLTFSPVIERVLPFSAPCRMQYFQFHTGNVFTIGDGPSDKTDHAEDYRRAEETGGLDVSVIGGKDGLQLAGEGCIFTHDKSPSWDTMTAEAAVRTLRHESWLNGVVEIQPKDFPITYLFKTARGECGLLQILGVSDEPLGMKLRYKLVQGSLPPPSLAATGIPILPWGVVSNGLQMSLSPVVEPNALVATKRFEVRIRNVGDKDIQLNLGISMANGKVHLPKAISLILTDAQGQARVLEFADKKYPGVAGRVDDFVIGLQAGATYALPLGLDQFWCPATREPQISLTNGPYRLTAWFVGRGAEHVNSDTAGMEFMNFWRGSLQSNPVELNVGERPGG